MSEKELVLIVGIKCYSGTDCIARAEGLAGIDSISERVVTNIAYLSTQKQKFRCPLREGLSRRWEGSTVPFL